MTINNITINSIDDIVKGKGLETADQLNHYVYKYTDCGAWIAWDDSSVTIGSIVEGSDAEFQKSFMFPVDSDELDAWITELEQLCDEAWNEANGICECEDWVSDLVWDVGRYTTPEEVTLEDAEYNLKQYAQDGVEVPLMMTFVLFRDLWNKYAAEWKKKNAE